MSLAINVQSSVTKRFYQEVAIKDKQSIWQFEFRCAAAQNLRSVCKRAFTVNFKYFSRKQFQLRMYLYIQHGKLVQLLLKCLGINL